MFCPGQVGPVLTAYQNFMYGAKRRCVFNPCSSTSDEVGSRFWKTVCHYIGAVGLLQVRQQQGHPQNLPLYRAVRRPLVSEPASILNLLALTRSYFQIRACILRGDFVQEWLQDGAQYGEEGPTLKLDSLMTRVAALRSKCLKVFRLKNPSRVLQSANADMVAEALDLDETLTQWSKDLPVEWRFSVFFVEATQEPVKSDLLYNDSVRYYTTHGHAAVWMRYLAVRLIVCSICLRLLSALPQWTSQGPSSVEQLKAYQESINLLATNMCCSVPFFFVSEAIHHDPESATFRINNKLTSPEILPRIATLLSWPLSVAVSTEAVPLAQKEWLKRNLKVAASVQGDAVVQSIAETEEFKF
jgi:hypothetical protein